MSGLVGWWPLHETEGDVAYDLSGNGNHGSVNGAIKGVAGRAGLSAYSFDGDSDSVEGPQNIGTGDSMTMTAWVRIKGAGDSSWNRIVTYDTSDTSGENHVALVWRPDDNNDRFFHVRGDGSSENAVVEGEPPLEEWVFVVGAWDGDTVKYYENAELLASVQHSISIDEQDMEVSIGARADRDSDWVNGAISDIRIYDRALSPSEIEKLYEQGSRDLHKKSLSDGSDVGAVSRWKLDDGGSDGSTAVDSWGSNDGTINGAAFTDNSVRNEGRALQFNGESDYVDVGNPNSLNISGSQTISAWVRMSSLDTDKWNIIAGKSESGNEQADLRSHSDDGNLIFLARNSSGSWYAAQTGVTTTKTWIHLVGVFESSKESIKVYANGELKDITNIEDDTLNQNGEPFQIGARAYDDSQSFFNGIIDDVRVFDRALSSWEVFELYRWGSLGMDMRKELVNAKGGGQ